MTTTPSQELDNKSIPQLEQEIVIQGNKVRELKLNSSDKSLVDKEIAILLSLKNDLKKLLTISNGVGGHGKSSKNQNNKNTRDSSSDYKVVNGDETVSTTAAKQFTLKTPKV